MLCTLCTRAKCCVHYVHVLNVHFGHCGQLERVCNVTLNTVDCNLKIKNPQNSSHTHNEKHDKEAGLIHQLDSKFATRGTSGFNCKPSKKCIWKRLN